MNELATRVHTILCTCLGQKAVDMTTELGDYNLDSLDLLDLNYRLEDEFSLEISPYRLGLFRTGRDIVAYLECPPAG